MTTNEPVVGMSLRAATESPPRDLAIRFLFGATISAIAAVVAIVLNPRIGGVFLAFPAILPATLTLIEQRESARKAKDDDVGAVLGSAALVLFGGLAWHFFPLIGAPATLAVAGAGWLVASVLMYLALRAVKARESN